MTKRAYVKPEWRAMGMPIAAGQIVPMGMCNYGDYAATCSSGEGVSYTGDDYCYHGPLNANFCTTGSVAKRKGNTNCEGGSWAVY